MTSILCHKIRSNEQTEASSTIDPIENCHLFTKAITVIVIAISPVGENSENNGQKTYLPSMFYRRKLNRNDEENQRSMRISGRLGVLRNNDWNLLAISSDIIHVERPDADRHRV